MPGKPIIVLSHPRGQCVTFFWPGRGEFYVGYRLFEHQPEMLDAPLAGLDEQPACGLGEMPALPGELLPAEKVDPLGQGWSNCYDEPEPAHRVQLHFKSFADGSAWACGLDNDGQQKREFFLQPAEDGAAMWMKITTEVDLPGACAVQQCLRFSGRTNQQWRRPIACIPPLSEFDVQADGKPNDTLTWVRKDGQWLRVPVQRCWYHTPGGQALVGDKSFGEIPHGLIVREDLEGGLASGVYWERTAYVSNRQPADCVHSVVDFGPLAAGESRTVHGKFYFLQGTKDQLLARWRNDFAQGQ